MVAIKILKVDGFSQEIVLFSGYTISLRIEVFSLYFNILKEYRPGRSVGQKTMMTKGSMMMNRNIWRVIIVCICGFPIVMEQLWNMFHNCSR